MVVVKSALLVVMCPRRGAGEPPEVTANVTTFRDGRVIEIVHHATPETARAAIGASSS
jgi:hypothetical protein